VATLEGVAANPCTAMAPAILSRHQVRGRRAARQFTVVNRVLVTSGQITSPGERPPFSVSTNLRGVGTANQK